MTDTLLSVDNLHVQFETPDGTVHAVDGVSVDVLPGETICLVGESGSGKTVTCEAVTGLVADDGGNVTGEIRFDGLDLTTLTDDELQEIRGNRIAHVFQNPQGALDPVYTIGQQLVESIRYHRDVSKATAGTRAIELLDRVGIPEPATRVDEYPHEFSGGMKQRALIAMALSCEPDLLIADEPTTALDVTIEASILNLLADLQSEFDMGLLFVTHDLGVVAQIADRVVVMYGGKVMERGDVQSIFDHPAHPYTRALIACLPGTGDLDPIGGEPIDPTDPPEGCRFHPRCSHAVPACSSRQQPDLYDVPDGDGEAACVFYGPHHDVNDLNSGPTANTPNDVFTRNAEGTDK